MKTENIDFIKEGILRYKNATNTYFSFRKYIKDELQEILHSYKEWGEWKPNLKSIKCTTFGETYPLLNAKIECENITQKMTLVIAINWYQSETENPFYCVWSENSNFEIKPQNVNEKYTFIENQLRLYPNFEKLNMKEDFELLLQEYLTIIN